MEGHSYGTRCPVCSGNTRLLLRRELALERTRDRTPRRLNFPLTPTLTPAGRGEFAVLMDNIRSAWNVGSIFRSADGFGFVHAYLCGITPTPEAETVMKTSLGAEDSVPWSYHKDSVKLVKGLKKEGFRILALEDAPRASSISDPGWSAKNEATDSVLILGSEVTGVDPELLDLSDAILYIPMQGEKKSFNVAMAFSVAAYALTKK
jgi:23S rRNA (guanosine2251-2'-O)-methyltransferase